MTHPYRHALLALVPVIGACAGVRPGPEPEPPHASARAVCATTALVPGRINEIGIHLTLERGWHVYWDGFNDSGFPLTAEWTLPPGFTAGPIRWPTPTRHVSAGGILDHVYEGEVTLIVPLDVPAQGSPAATVGLTADLAWLACKDRCVRETQTLALSLPVAAAGAAPPPSADARLFDQARSRLPRALPSDQPPATFHWSKDAVEIRVPGAAELVFYPGNQCTRLADPIRDGQVKNARMGLAFSPLPDAPPLRLQGILEVRSFSAPSRTAYYEVDVRGTP